MQLPKLPYSNQLRIRNEIKIFWGSRAAWEAAKRDRLNGDMSCLVLPRDKSISEFNLSLFRGWPILIKEFFIANEKEERFLAGALLKAGATHGALLRVAHQPTSFQIFGDVYVRGQCNE